MEELKRKKSRTAITIDPVLWEASKQRCIDLSHAREGKVSFSQLVEEALKAYLGR